MKFFLASAAAAVGMSALNTVTANDPSEGWLSYVTYNDPQNRQITALNTTWTVPSRPKSMFGSNAPGWWFGIQTDEGDGALVQPILAWGYQGDEYTIFDACFDWTDASWHTSEDSYTVKPGDTITSSITYKAEDNSYDMYIVSADTGNSVSMNYKIQAEQTKNESRAYFVLEHQPSHCSALPTNGECTFSNVYLEVDGEEVKDVAWESMQETPVCKSKAVVTDSTTLTFTWDPTASIDEDATTNSTGNLAAKWEAVEATGTVPTLPPVFTSDVVATTAGTFPGVPKGTKSYTEYHDFTNKRQRLDFKEDFYTKIYRYDVLSWDHNPFPAPKGYKIHLDAQGQPEKMGCCWLWLVDADSGDNDEMTALSVPKNAKDAGATTINGIAVEQWSGTSVFPFKQSEDVYLANGTTPVQWNTFANVFGKGTVIGNSTYTNFVAGPISNSTFDVPDSRPTFGICKQCGVDPECPMEECMS